ncbi:hypothetical protein SSAG_00753 [Streptomyces sp. Mg1]|nr:hypothetical protein SSAG_00753 [Streptomyces sp. Mg1]
MQAEHRAEDRGREVTREGHQCAAGRLPGPAFRGAHDSPDHRRQRLPGNPHLSGGREHADYILITDPADAERALGDLAPVYESAFTEPHATRGPVTSR